MLTGQAIVIVFWLILTCIFGYLYFLVELPNHCFARQDTIKPLPLKELVLEPLNTLGLYEDLEKSFDVSVAGYLLYFKMNLLGSLHGTYMIYKGKFNYINKAEGIVQAIGLLFLI